MKLLVIIVLICISSSILADDICDHTELANCFTMEHFLTPQVAWPTTDRELLSLCDKLATGDKCLMDFHSRCTETDEEKVFLGEIYPTFIDYSRNICTIPLNRTKFLGRVKECYSLPSVSPALREQHTRYVALIEAVYGLKKSERQQALGAANFYFNDVAHDINNQCSLKVHSEIMVQMDMIFSGWDDDFFSTTADSLYEDLRVQLPENVQKIFDEITNSVALPKTKLPYFLPTMFQLFKEGF